MRTYNPDIFSEFWGIIMKKIIKPLLVITFFFGLSTMAQARDCDRSCLIKLSDDYVAAMVAHNPKAVPFSRNVRMVENLKKIKPGEGLWQSAAAGPDKFVIHVPDPVAQQVGYMAVLTENIKGKPTPVELGLRLKLVKGKITEAESLVVRNLTKANLSKHLQVPRLPLVSPVLKPYRDSRSRLLYIGASYYDALDNNNGSLAPFADDCVRYENGGQSTRNPVPTGKATGFSYLGSLGCAAQIDTNAFEYITHIGNRRVWIADVVDGLAFGMSQFHHAFTKHDFRLYGVPGEKMRHMEYDPFDMPAFHIFKIWGGKIHEIEAVGIVTPYMSPTGWE